MPSENCNVAPCCGGRKRRCGCAMGKMFRFVEPLLLLELARTPEACGYDLVERLASRPLTPAAIDKAVVYRTLNALEFQGMLSASWTDAERGAGRKVYRLTPQGKAHLVQWNGLLAQLAQGLQEFCREASRL